MAAGVVEDHRVLSVDRHRASADPNGGTGAAARREGDDAGRADEQDVAVTLLVGQHGGVEHAPLGAEAVDDGR